MDRSSSGIPPSAIAAMGVVTCALMLSAAVSGVAAQSAPASATLTKQAKVSMVAARAIALKQRPGKITDEELETERGGSGLRYSFDIKNANNKYEVGVDAKTGKVLESRLEGNNLD